MKPELFLSPILTSMFLIPIKGKLPLLLEMVSFLGFWSSGFFWVSSYLVFSSLQFLYQLLAFLLIICIVDPFKTWPWDLLSLLFILSKWFHQSLDFKCPENFIVIPLKVKFLALMFLLKFRHISRKTTKFFLWERYPLILVIFTIKSWSISTPKCTFYFLILLLNCIPPTSQSQAPKVTSLHWFISQIQFTYQSSFYSH